MTEAVNMHLKLARGEDERVTPIELILDVVFVLAFSECTTYMVHQGGWLGIADGIIMLALLWRGWVGFAWLTNAIDPNSTFARVALFTSMGAFLMMSLTIPRAFGDLSYGFVGAYAVIRLVHICLGLAASKHDEQFRMTVIRNAIGALPTVTLLVVGAFIDGLGGYLCWALAVIVDYAIGTTFSKWEWRLAAGHFAERHALILIIALGESILAIGAGAEFIHLDSRATLLALSGVILVACLWGTYFDGTETAAEHMLGHKAPGIERNRAARQAYSLLHFPLVVGDVLIALGLKSAIAHPARPFEQHIAGSFFGGLGLYLLAHVAFRYRMTKLLNIPRLCAGVLMVAMIPLGSTIPAWISLTLATAVLVVVVVPQRLIRRQPSVRRSGTATG